MNTIITLNDIINAKKRISPYITHTPLIFSDNLSKILNCNIYIKPEMLQTTGSFKIRGASNKILSLSESELKKGIICNSSGNHGKACAYMGHKLGIKSIVIMSDTILQSKIDDIESLGGTAILAGGYYEDRLEILENMCKTYGYTHVHPYEDPLIMAGQGTCGLEILDDLPSVDTIIAPVGGGGLISGVSVAAKSVNTSITTIGVQPEVSAAYVASRRAGHPVEVGCPHTLGDALCQRNPGKNPYPVIERYVDILDDVSEDMIYNATKIFAKETHLLAEPSSCVGLALLLSHKYIPKNNENIVLIVTSGNWPIDGLGKIYANV